MSKNITVTNTTEEAIRDTVISLVHSQDKDQNETPANLADEFLAGLENLGIDKSILLNCTLEAMQQLYNKTDKSEEDPETNPDETPRPPT